MTNFRQYIGLAGLAALITAMALYSLDVSAMWATGTFVAGVAIILLHVLLNWREVSTWFRSRSARHGANAIVMSSLFAACLVVVQAISVQNTHQLDVTRNQRFTLAEQTTNLISQLEQPLTLFAFFRANSPRRGQANELLRLYAMQSKQVRVEFIDPDKEPRRADEMNANYNEVVVDLNGQRKIVREITEQRITNAILAATRHRSKAIYFVTGHSEKDIDSDLRIGFSSARQALEGEGYTVSNLNLVGIDKIPEDCVVLVVAGPKRDYLAQEVELISEYLDGGGSALLLLEPRNNYVSLQPILETYHFALDDLVILDELVLFDAGDRLFDATVAKVRQYVQHPITRGFNAYTLFPMSRSIRIVENELDRTVTTQYLGITSESAWGEVNMDSFTKGEATADGEDIAGPLPIGAVSVRSNKFVITPKKKDKEPESRVVAIGDSDFANNSYLGVLGNRDFFLNIFNFLAEEEDLISIRAKPGIDNERVFITAAQERLIRLLSLVLLPGSVIASGVSVMLRKRRHS